MNDATMPNAETVVPVDATLAERMHLRFAGAEKRYGTYFNGLRLVGDKMEMDDDAGSGAREVPGQPPTIELWQRHLDGDRPLGVSPLREDGMCRWGVVDLDGKDVPGGYAAIDHADIWARCQREGLPLVVCRSKSGGAHILLFCSEWVEQSAMNAALANCAARLRLSAKIDKFPPAEGKGNWLNMPYFGGDATDRYGVKKGGMAMGLEEFVYVAEEAAVGPEIIAELARPSRSKKDAAAGPERAQRDLKRFAGEIAVQAEGGRATQLNRHAFSMGRMVGAGWIGEEEVSNALLRAAMENPIPLKVTEALGHVQSGLKAGQKEPMEDDANADRFPAIETLTVWTGGEDPIWEFQLTGWPKVKMTVREAMNYRHFNTRCAEAGIGPFRPLKEAAWNDRLSEARRTAEVKQIPKDETVEFQFRELLSEFLFDRNRSDQIADLHLRKPVHIDEEDRIYFLFQALQRHAASTSGAFRYASLQRLGGLIRSLLGENHGKTTKKVNGKSVEITWVRMSAFDQIEGEIPLPPIPGEPI